MNKRITKKEAVRKHRAMWNWIADYIEKKKEEQCIYRRSRGVDCKWERKIFLTTSLEIF